MARAQSRRPAQTVSPTPTSPAKATAPSRAEAAPESTAGLIRNSPFITAQRKQLDATFGAAIGAGGEVLQRVVSLETLQAKLAEGGAYSGTIDSATPWATANAVGSTWVGEGAHAQFYGASAWDSMASETRQYRPPMLKQSGVAADQVQANYEAKTGHEGGYNFNAHVTISDLDQESLKAKKETYHKDYKDKKPEPEKKTPEGGDDEEEDTGVGGLFD